MKKHIVLALILALAALVALTFTACGNNNDTPNGPDATETKPTETTPPVAQNPGDTFYGYTTLTLAKDPFVDSEGRLVLYFNENIICTETTTAYIGMKAIGAADSIKATPALNAYSDMYVENKCHGIALVPEYEMDTGTYDFSVTIGNMYIVEFEYTVK